MNKKELKLAADLLKLASEEFANHGCNDFEFPDTWSDKECDAFVWAMHTWNGDPEEYSPGNRVTTDWFVMSYLASKLKEASLNRSVANA